MGSMLDVVASAPRREVLSRLQEEKSLHVEDVATDRQSHIKLHHVHLPKLEAAGAIRTEGNMETVSRGENWESAQHLLQQRKRLVQ